MLIVSIKRCHGGAVKIRAEVRSNSDPSVSYRIGYIRSKSFRGWVCNCEDFFNRRIATNRNCKHIKEVRAENLGQPARRSDRTSTFVSLQCTQNLVGCC